MHGVFMAREKKPWWREAALVNPALGLKEVEGRILTACRTLRALPDPDEKFRHIGTAWPEMLKSAAEAYGYTEAVMPRFRPSPADVSDCLLALSWARPVNWKEFRLIWWRSFDLSFHQMSMRIHRSHDTARRWYTDALYGVWHEANRQNRQDVVA